jgi:hypothetical protein
MVCVPAPAVDVFGAAVLLVLTMHQLCAAVQWIAAYMYGCAAKGNHINGSACMSVCHNGSVTFTN